MAHYLPSKVAGYLLRLHLQYDRTGKHLERDLIAGSRVFVIEETDYDNWNGGVYGHDVQLFAPIELLAKVDIDKQESVTQGICEDLRKLSTAVENEFFNAVRLEVDDEGDPNFQRAIPFAAQAGRDPESTSFWKSGMVRLFISHRDEHKVKANELAAALEPYGISAFVAHDTILPMTEWQDEIKKGLETMEVMLVFLTDNFDDSVWTNQEVGFALGRSVPIISLKLERKNPPGFLSATQAMRGALASPAGRVEEIFSLIGNSLSRKDRLNEILLNALISANSFDEARRRFIRMEQAVQTLTESQVEKLVSGFNANDQLHYCWYLTKSGNIERFLKNISGKEFEIFNNQLRLVQKVNGDLPF